MYCTYMRTYLRAYVGTLDRLQAEKGMLPKSDSVAKASVIPSVKGDYPLICTCVATDKDCLCIPESLGV